MLKKGPVLPFAERCELCLCEALDEILVIWIEFTASFTVSFYVLPVKYWVYSASKIAETTIEDGNLVVVL